MQEYKKIIQNKLYEYFLEYKKNSSYSKNIWEAMEYTVLLEGKRLRAIMCLEIAKQLGVSLNDILPFAASCEIMHAYSLIHDDLPCMDNDDLRRGKPANHKVFGEATALLAGDALISFGAQIIIDKAPDSLKKEILIEIIRDYLVCAGALGLVAGQCADIEAEGKKIDIDNLEYIHKYKTGALFKYSIITGAKLASIDKKTLDRLSEYADNFGLLFQIYDDIMDCTKTTGDLGKTAGKDEKENKSTYVSILGLDNAKNIFYSAIDKNHAILKELNINSNIFNSIYDLLISRIKN